MGLWWWQPRAASDPSASCADRRTSPRKPGSRVLACQVIMLPGNRPIQVAIRDISAAGLGLRSELPIPPGIFLVVQLQGSSGVKRSFRARVAHCTPQDAGQWILGCVLERELTSQELEEFL
jgi:hypothetical protein